MDMSHAGEIVRARHRDGAFQLHEGGDSYLTLPPTAFTSDQVSPSRDEDQARGIEQRGPYIGPIGQRTHSARPDSFTGRAFGASTRAETGANANPRPAKPFVQAAIRATVTGSGRITNPRADP